MKIRSERALAPGFKWSASMYNQFYGLREKPFSLSPDPRFLYLSDSHREALAHLLYGIEQGEGFIAITGEVGTGKTTLCRTLLRRLEPGTEVAFIFNPQLSGLELLQAIGAEFGLETRDRTRRELTEQLNRFLLRKKQEGRQVLLLIDEAQTLEPDALEQVRLLSNLETDTAKLLQIILIGQPELDAMLASPNLRQLRQRITVRWRLESLSVGESRAYVRHRLRIAAGANRELFTEAALREIHRRSGGIPRLINLLCDRALLAGYAEGARSIGLGLVVQTRREVKGVPESTGARRAEMGRRLRRWLGLAGPGVGVVLLLVVAAVGLFELRESRGAAGRAEPAAPVASATPPVSSPAPASPAPALASNPAMRSSLAFALAASSPAATASASLDALLAAWRRQPVQAGLLSLEQVLAVLRAEGFQVKTLHDTSLDELRTIDRPAFLSLSALDGAPRHALLRSVHGDTLRLEGLGKGELSVPWKELEPFWDGDAMVPFLTDGQAGAKDAFVPRLVVDVPLASAGRGPS